MFSHSDEGHWIEDGVLALAECQELIAVMARLREKRSRVGARHLMSMPEVARLAADRRLLGIAQQALGAGAVPFRATLFEKSAHANWQVVWHQDTALPLKSYCPAPDWGPWSSKEGIRYAHALAWALNRILAVRVHLDHSTTDNGPLRVIPRSHLAGVLSDEAVLAYAHRHPWVECLVACGGVLAMRPLLIHSSSKARVGDPRGVIHFEYADSLQLSPEIQLAIA